MRSLLETAMRINQGVDHPAYDCVYLALWPLGNVELGITNESFCSETSSSPTSSHWSKSHFAA